MKFVLENPPHKTEPLINYKVEQEEISNNHHKPPLMLMRNANAEQNQRLLESYQRYVAEYRQTHDNFQDDFFTNMSNNHNFEWLPAELRGTLRRVERGLTSQEIAGLIGGGDLDRFWQEARRVQPFVRPSLFSQIPDFLGQVTGYFFSSQRATQNQRNLRQQLEQHRTNDQNLTQRDERSRVVIMDEQDSVMHDQTRYNINAHNSHATSENEVGLVLADLEQQTSLHLDECNIK